MQDDNTNTNPNPSSQVQDTQAPQSQNPEDNVVDKISDEFSVSLPGKNLPPLVRIIAFFTLGGALSVIGSLFAEDIIRPSDEDIYFYIIRTIVGLVALVVGYGIIKRERWAIWLYAGLAMLSALTNPFFAFVPGLVVLYLYTQRKYFKPTPLDNFLAEIISYIRNLLHMNKDDSSTPQSG